MKYLLPILLAMLALAQRSSATNVSGLIDGTVTWTKANSPYVVNGDVLVKDGATLYIEPGVEVRFEWVAFNIDGAIRAVGTSAEPIVFKLNSTSGFGGVKINGVGIIDSIIFDHCNFENSFHGIRAGGGNISISNCTVTQCWVGIEINSNDGFLLTNNVVKHCKIGLSVQGKGLLDKNEVAHTTEQSIAAYNHVSLTNNYVHDCVQGIEFGGGSGQPICEISNNTVVNVQQSGFDISGDIKGGAYGNLSVNNGIGYKLRGLYTPVQYNTAIGNKTGVTVSPGGAGFLFKNNCILNSTGYYAVMIGNKYDELDITNNYWGTNDSAILTSKLYDFTDSFNYPTGHILPALSQLDAGCKQYTGPVVTKIQDTKSNSVTITVSPNPFTDRFSIDLQSKATTLEVFNMAGQKLVSIDASGKTKTEVDMSAYPAGVYHYRVAFSDHTTTTGKLIKQ